MPSLVMPFQNTKRPGSAIGIAAKERRNHPRYAVTAIAQALELQSNTRIGGRISDIGQGGCYMEVMSPFAIGTEVTVRITKDDSSFTAKARVSYSKGGMGMGMVFTAVEPGQRPVLDRWIGELSGNLAPVPRAEEVEQEIESVGNGRDEHRNSFNDLITTLIRKGVLTDAEGKPLLQKRFP
jgi:PilZ domain-containing protein